MIRIFTNHHHYILYRYRPYGYIPMIDWQSKESSESA